MFNPKPININPVPDPDRSLRKGSRQTSAEGASHPESEPIAAGRVTRSASRDTRKDSQSSVNQPSKGQNRRSTTRHDAKDSQVPQPSQRKRGGSASSKAASRRHAAGSRNRNFTPTESRISEEAADEVIEVANPKSEKNKHASTKPNTTQKPRNMPNGKESPRQPSPSNPHPKPSPGASIPPKQNDSSPQESLINSNRNFNCPTSNQTPTDTHKMPPPPTPAIPEDQKYRIKKRKRSEADEDEGTSTPVTLDLHIPNAKS